VVTIASRKVRASGSESWSPRLNGDSSACQRISSTHERPMPAIALIAQQRVQRPRRVQQRAERIGWVGPGLGAERRQRVVLLERGAAQQLRPSRLVGAELTQAQLATVVDAHQQPRGTVAQPGALVVELQPAGGHQVHQQREIVADVDDHMLADPPHAGDPLAVERRQRRIERLQRVDARRERRLDAGAAQRVVKPTRGDLDLGKLWQSDFSMHGSGARRTRLATG
jgi:hypothetical protein